MSKFVKDLITSDIKQRLDSVEDCVVVNVIGLDANSTVTLRRELREKNISLMVIKNSLARRATDGTSLGPAFEGLDGTAAVMWGAEDYVSLVKEVSKYDKSDDFAAFEARGGVMDGEKMSGDRIREISTWPSREEQLSLLVGQILGPGSQLQSQIIGPGGQLASQIEKKSEEE